jgi:prephenate dehydrogenase/chorismate mutase
MLRKRLGRKGDLDRLKDFRAQMREITKSILELVVARQKLASRIAEIKETSGFAVENQRVEEKLCSEMVEYARHLGLDGELAKRIVFELIDYSKVVQRREIHLPSIRKYLHSIGIKTVTVFGAGRMGGWFARYFAEAGARVLLFDGDIKVARARARELSCIFTRDFATALESDLLIVAVPITATPGLVLRLAREGRAGRVVRIMEISSVKNEVKKLNTSLGKNVKLYSIHPLFGPFANSFAENSLILVGEDSTFVKRVFPHYKIFSMNPKDHDRLMATLLTLPHVHALSFADTVTKSKIPARIHSPSFDRLMDLSRRVLGESARVYYEIQSTNPFADGAINETIKSLRRLKGLLENEARFEKFFDENRRALT